MGENGTRKSKKRKHRSQKPPTLPQRSKRLLDLVMLLLRSRSPIAFREIRTQFDAYNTSNSEAGLRSFERDKAELLAMGVPIRYVTAQEDISVEDGGYVIDLQTYRLPEVHLSSEEISALILAASVARAIPGNSHAQVCDLALRKLSFDYDEPTTQLVWPKVQGSADGSTKSSDPIPNNSKRHESVLVHFPEGKDLELSGRFSLLEAATRGRKSVRIAYQSASDGQIRERKVDPYGLFYRDRSWLVVGHCHLRDATRAFRLDRISTLSVAPKPKSPDFERPSDFTIRAYASRSPWTFHPQSSERMQLELAEEALSVANEDFGENVVSEEFSYKNGTIGVRISFDSGNPEFVVSRVLAAKGAMRILRGARCKQLLREELAAIEDLYA